MFATIFRRCFSPLAPACLIILVAVFWGESFGQATVPGPPVLRYVDLGDGQLTVTWKAPENTGSGIDSYKVTADPGTPDSPSDDRTCTSTETGEVTITCTLTGLTNGTAYTMRVVATNSAGDSTPSFSTVATPSIRDAGGRIYVYSPSETKFVRYPKLGSFLSEAAEGRRLLPEYFGVRIITDTQDNVDVIMRFLSDNGVQHATAYKGDADDLIKGEITVGITVNLLVPLSNQPSVRSVQYLSRPRAQQLPADPSPPDTTSAMAHKATAWHSAGYDGTGVKVGVIDLGFQDFRTDFGTRTIKARCYSRIPYSLDTTSAVDSCETRTTHGTKVTQSLLDIAPEVSLYISNPFYHNQLPGAVNWMKEQGVRVINYSVAWLWDGPGDGTSPFPNSPLNIVDTAVADSIIWVNAAGNFARTTWYSASPTWTSSSNLVFDSAGDTCNAVSLTQGRIEFFQVRWAGAWRNANTDLTLYLLNSAGTDTVAVSSQQQRGEDDHYPNDWIEYIPVSSGSHCLMVAKIRSSDPSPAWVQLQVFSGDLELRLEHHTARSITNPAESANAGMLAVGAAHYSSRAIEPFSSRGPTPDGRTKPDIVGVDGYNSLKGTSFGSPHVAGLAALVIDRYANDANYDTPAEIAAYLKNNARDLGNAGADNTWGHGFAELPAPPTATLVLSPASISENGGMATVTATLDRTATTATTITVSATAVSPAAPRDFTLSTAKTLTIAANATASTGVVTITANNNTVRAATKSVTVSGTAAGVAGPSAVTLRIIDDDTPQVTLALSSASISENGGMATVTATLDRTATTATTITISATAVPPAASGVFTLSTAKTLTIAANATTSTGVVTITAVNDTTDATDKSVTISGTATGGDDATEPFPVTLTIPDDDAAPTVTLALSASAIGENGGISTVTATLSHPSSAATTITVRPVADAYTVGSDSTMVIVAGSTTAVADTVAITAVDNARDEADRAVTVSGVASNAQGVGTVTGAALTLTDDDDPPVLSIDSTSVAEGAAGATATLQFTVSLDAASNKEVTVDYAEATGRTATQGTDYTALTAGTLTFAASDTSKTIDVSVTGDAENEPDETVIVTLRNAVNATFAGGDTTLMGTGTITNDDQPSLTMDIDDDGTADLTDAIMVTLYLFGLENEGITDYILFSAQAQRTDPQEVTAYIKTLIDTGRIDVDDDGVTDMTDVTMIMLYLFGLENEGITDYMLFSAQAKRTDPQEVTAYIATLIP